MLGCSTIRNTDVCLRYVDAAQITQDGNFHYSMTNKHTDPKDPAMTKGASYYAHEDDSKLFLETTEHPEHEVRQLGYAGERLLNRP